MDIFTLVTIYLITSKKAVTDIGLYIEKLSCIIFENFFKVLSFKDIFLCIYT